ncbi:MAG: hypothetical protein HS108_04730 [Planctomycetes bacterium]|nr:hypothetical protein [Planctomycetota bacterium]
MLDAFYLYAGPPATLAPKTQATMGLQLNAFHAACVSAGISNPSDTNYYASNGINPDPAGVQER